MKLNKKHRVKTCFFLIYQPFEDSLMSLPAKPNNFWSAYLCARIFFLSWVLKQVWHEHNVIKCLFNTAAKVGATICSNLLVLSICPSVRWLFCLYPQVGHAGHTLEDNEVMGVKMKRVREKKKKKKKKEKGDGAEGKWLENKMAEAEKKEDGEGGRGGMW